MAAGLIDDAPVFPDVTTLRGVDVTPDVRAIAAGFPCQDISIAGVVAKGGIDGERSGLFKELVRLLRELPSVQYVFLENVPNIHRRGLDTVTGALTALGFDHAHGVFAANEVGALHVRKRWFLLGVRSGAPAPPACTSTHLEHAWNAPPERLIPTASTPQAYTARQKRYQMLGNSVVPQCVALAFQTLAAASTSSLGYGRSL